MPDLLRSAFNRRFVVIPILIAIALIATVSYITEARRNELMDTASNIREAQERIRILAELSYAAADVESEGRGYLLTHDTQFLQPYEDAIQRIDVHLRDLKSAYTAESAEAKQIAELDGLVQNKVRESQQTITATTQDRTSDGAKLTHTVEGLYWMKEIRARIEAVRDHERQRIYDGVESWRIKHQQAGTINVATAMLSAILLVVTGIFITRDIDRRNDAVTELDKLVEQRTRELTELSNHLQGVTEREKSQLARELHDELGGLLVSIKMDLMQVAKKIDLSNPDLKVRWQRIQDAISAGVELKRRVIEELRPTLLDNMGLVAALSWQAEQTCSRAGVALETDFPETEPELNNDAAIALFRVAQEALTNLVKHAHASAARISLRINSDDLVLSVEDNGVGINSHTRPASGSHGLVSMKHRIQAIGGTFRIGPATPHGTQVMVRVPIVTVRMALRA